MKKYLPFILLGIGIIVLVVVFIVIKGKKTTSEVTDDVKLIDVPLNQRPIASLIPSADGHWLKLKIEKLTLPKAESLDYELLYQLPDGRTQGVPGTVPLKGLTTLERDLLLGSESSGKFRYDEGVKEGSLTIRLRDGKGKLMAKFSTKFHFQVNDKEITSADGTFNLMLGKVNKGVYYVTMETFGLSKAGIDSVTAGPYGIFPSNKAKVVGTLSSGWTEIADNTYIKK